MNSHLCPYFYIYALILCLQLIKTSKPTPTYAWDAQMRNKNSTNHKTGPPLPRHCLKQQSSPLQYPLSMPVEPFILSFTCPHPVSSALGGWDLVSTESM